MTTKEDFIQRVLVAALAGRPDEAKRLAGDASEVYKHRLEEARRTMEALRQEIAILERDLAILLHVTAFDGVPSAPESAVQSQFFPRTGRKTRAEQGAQRLVVLEAARVVSDALGGRITSDAVQRELVRRGIPIERKQVIGVVLNSAKDEWETISEGVYRRKVPSTGEAPQ